MTYLEHCMNKKLLCPLLEYRYFVTESPVIINYLLLVEKQAKKFSSR